MTAALETVGLREANQQFSRIAERVARTGQGVLVTRRGAPVVRILPAEVGDDGLAAEQRAILDSFLGEGLELAPWRFDRDELYDR